MTDPERPRRRAYLRRDDRVVSRAVERLANGVRPDHAGLVSRVPAAVAVFATFAFTTRLSDLSHALLYAGVLAGTAILLLVGWARLRDRRLARRAVRIFGLETDLVAVESAARCAPDLREPARHLRSELATIADYLGWNETCGQALRRARPLAFVVRRADGHHQAVRPDHARLPGEQWAYPEHRAAVAAPVVELLRHTTVADDALTGWSTTASTLAEAARAVPASPPATTPTRTSAPRELRRLSRAAARLAPAEVTDGYALDAAAIAERWRRTGGATPRGRLA